MAQGNEKNTLSGVECGDDLTKIIGRKEGEFGCQSEIVSNKIVPVRRSLRLILKSSPPSPIKNARKSQKRSWWWLYIPMEVLWWVVSGWTCCLVCKSIWLWDHSGSHLLDLNLKACQSVWLIFWNTIHLSLQFLHKELKRPDRVCVYLYKNTDRVLIGKKPLN